MDFLEKALADFAAERSPENLVKIEIPEWDRTLYFWPEMNLEEARRINKYRYQDGTFDAEGLAMMLIVRARDKNGKLLFTPSHRIDLTRNVSMKVIARIASEMRFGKESEIEIEDTTGAYSPGEALSIEDAEKN